jgi:hypothetical protein
MTQKICFDCFHKLFPDKPILKVTLGRQCVVCKAQTDRTEQMIPIEAEDIPLVKQTDINFRVGIGDLVDLLEPHRECSQHPRDRKGAGDMRWVVAYVLFPVVGALVGIITGWLWDGDDDD